jgi:signal transduction histidine kinase
MKRTREAAKQSMLQFVQKLERHSRTAFIAAALMIVTAIGAVDYLTGFETSFSIFYLLAIGLATWFVGRGFAVFVSIMSVAVSLAGDLANGAHFSSPLVPAWNAIILIAFYLVMVWLLTALHSLQRELETRVQQRTAALQQEIAVRERLERELLEISERGQRQVGHDLHDSLGQHLTATAFAGQVLNEQLESKSLPESAAARHLVKMVEEAIILTRTFARGLLPVEMEGEGLMDGFQDLARKTSERFTVSCEFDCREPVLLNDAENSTHLYRIAQEAITNAIKHGKAKHISIRLEKTNRVITLTITDDGVGLPENARNGQGLGLHIMAYRANLIGAIFDIGRLPGSGTCVTCKLPSGSMAVPETHGAKN